MALAERRCGAGLGGGMKNWLERRGARDLVCRLTQMGYNVAQRRIEPNEIPL